MTGWWWVVGGGGWVLAALLAAPVIGSAPRVADRGSTPRCMCRHRGDQHHTLPGRDVAQCLLCDGLACVGFRQAPRRPHLHWHRVVRRDHGTQYLACRCGSRHVYRPRGSGYVPVHVDWLRGGDWSTGSPHVLPVQTREPSAPPRGPAGTSRPPGMPRRGPSGPSGQARAR